MAGYFKYVKGALVPFTQQEIDDLLAFRSARTAAIAAYVPPSVTNKQFRAAISQTPARRTALLNYIQSLPSADQDYWQFSTSFLRSDSQIAAAATALGLTGAQVDNFFRNAASLQP